MATIALTSKQRERLAALHAQAEAARLPFQAYVDALSDQHDLPAGSTLRLDLAAGVLVVGDETAPPTLMPPTQSAQTPAPPVKFELPPDRAALL